VRNHDLDFDVEQFGHLMKICESPWLCANVEDPSLGEGASIAGLQKGLMLTASNGAEIGVVEKKWLGLAQGLPGAASRNPGTSMVKAWVSEGDDKSGEGRQGWPEPVPEPALP